MKEATKSNSGSQLIGVILILLGAAFFVNQYLEIDIFHFAWPFFIIVPGVVAYLGSLALPEAPGRGLSAAGSILTMIGLILLYQNTFDHFETWAYAWALVAPTSLGLGWIGYGLVRRNAQIRQEGARIAGVGLVIFLVAGAFFELVIGLSGFRLPWADNLWPVLLILLGVVLLARNLFGGVRKS